MSTSSVVLLPHAPASVGTARWQLADELRRAGVGEPALGDAALILSELMSNAIRHARPLSGARVQASWRVGDGWAEISVTDGGASTRPHAARPSLSSIGGRGLTIVNLLAASWGVLRADEGTTVWAVLPLANGNTAAGGPANGFANRAGGLAAGAGG